MTRAPKGARWRCCACGAIFDSYPKAERHADAEHGAARIDQLIGVRCAVCAGLLVRGDAGAWIHSDLSAWADAPHDAERAP